MYIYDVHKKGCVNVCVLETKWISFPSNSECSAYLKLLEEEQVVPPIGRLDMCEGFIRYQRNGQKHHRNLRNFS